VRGRIGHAGKEHSILLNQARRVMRWAAYLGGGLVCLLILLACAGALYQWIGGSWDRYHNPPPGQFVEVNGLRMHLVCAGLGSPPVILDSGLSNSWLDWYKVQPKVAKFTRVCSYDRAGVGYSDTRPGPRTSRVIAEELHMLLRNAEVAPPFVLVGHSMGGLDVRMYASLYRAEVAGVVLVDSSHPDQARHLADYERNVQHRRREIERDRALMPFGIPRLLAWCGSWYGTTVGGRQAALRSFECTVRQKDGPLAEMDGFNDDLDQVRATGSLGDMPLVVVAQAPSSARAKSFLPVWYELQDDLARLSSRGSRVNAQGSGHMIALERPDVVIAAIRDVVAQCRRQ
jgi:pimeloyl-ACP methyl ester carboxylesterase